MREELRGRKTEKRGGQSEMIERTQRKDDRGRTQWEERAGIQRSV